MKYIDAERLKAEIEWQKRENLGSPECVCDDILSLIESLQQEQPEVNLEKELRRSFQTIPGTSKLLFDDFEMIARHFYELGCRHVAVLYDDIEYERQRREAGEKEVDLEEEITRCVVDEDMNYDALCHHFYELGLNARKEE